MRFDLIVAALLPLAAMAEPVTPADERTAAERVVVIRGSQAPERGRPEQAVIVMRPEPGSFMRETTRLAAEAEARDERIAREEAREANLRLISALRALEDAAAAVQQRQHSDHLLVLSPATARGPADRRTPVFHPVSTGTPPTP